MADEATEGAEGAAPPQAEGAAPPKAEDDAPKQMRTCYMCAERCDVVDFEEKHATKCRKLWMQERGLPEEKMAQAPKDPADVYEGLLGGKDRNRKEDNKKLGNKDLLMRLDDLSMRVWKQQSLKKCPNCNRTFLLSKFKLHAKGCHAQKGVHWMETAGGQAGRYVSGTGGGLNIYEFPGKREGTTVPMNPQLDPGWKLTEFTYVQSLTRGGQAECAGVRVGDKIIAICGTAVITAAEVEAEWTKARPDPENDDTPHPTNTFTFRQILQLDATTVVLDLNRDLGMELTEGGVIKSIHLDDLAEKCQAEIAGLTCGRKVDQVGSLFQAPVETELQIEDIKPTLVKNRWEFEAAVDHRKRRFGEMGLVGPLWCRVRFCAVGKIDPQEPLGLSVCRKGKTVVVRSVDEGGQVALGVPSLQVGCRIESVSGCCISRPDQMRQIFAELKKENQRETYINFSAPMHYVPPDKSKVDLKHVKYINSGPPPLEEKADRGDDTLRYGTFWGDTLKADAMVGKRVLVDAYVVEKALGQLAAAAGDTANAPSKRKPKRSMAAKQLTELSKTLLQSTTDGTSALRQLGDPSDRLATVVGYRAKTELFTVELVSGDGRRGQGGLKVEVPPSAVRTVGWDKDLSGDLVESLLSLDIAALRAVAESDMKRRCHSCRSENQETVGKGDAPGNGINSHSQEVDPHLRALDDSLEAHQRMVGRVERISETLTGMAKRRNRAALAQQAIDSSHASGQNFIPIGMSRGAGDWDGKAFSLYGSGGFGEDEAGNAIRRKLAVSAISRADQWAKRNSSQGVSMSWG